MRMLRQIQLKFLSASADTLRKQKKRVRHLSYYLGTLKEQEWSSIGWPSLELARLSGKLGSLIRAKHYQYGDDFPNYE